ncbi:MAG TPA: hypothetical protein VGL36_35770 [Kribbella sp.]
MTNGKHIKRTARQLAAAEHISYAAARRRLDDEPELIAWADANGGFDDGGAEIADHVTRVLTRHTVFCVGEACQDAIDLGVDLDDQARQVAAQALDEKPHQCRCGSHRDPDVAPWTNYRVTVKFDKPLIPDETSAVTDFAARLFDALGIYSGITAPWEPGQVNGTGIKYVDAQTVIVNVTIPILLDLQALAAARQTGDAWHRDAEEAVRRALAEIGCDDPVQLRASRIVPDDPGTAETQR